MNLKIAILVFVVSYSDQAQGTFQNLDFESANLAPTPPNAGATYVSVTSGLPDWNAYIGSAQQTQLLQNDYTLGQASVDIFGPNYPAAGNLPSSLPGIIDGNYSVLLQSGGLNGVPFLGASIAQEGVVPLGSQTLEFKAWTTASTEFSVSFNGNNLSPIVLGIGANYILYGADISPYAGQTGPLEFTADFSQTGASWLGLDDIAFSTQAVPEPSIFALTTIGGLLFGARKWFARRR